MKRFAFVIVSLAMLMALPVAAPRAGCRCEAQQPMPIVTPTRAPLPGSMDPANPQVTIAPLAGNLLTNVQYPLNVTGFTPAVQDIALVKAYPATGANVTWTPIGNKGKATVLFLATQPGGYTIVIAYVLGDGSVATAEQVVTVGGSPTPVNPPQPGPAPQPSPPDNQTKIKPGKLWLIVTVPSLTQLTGDLAAVQRSVVLRQLLDGSKNHFRMDDPATAPPDIVPYVNLAGGKPTCFIVNQDTDSIAEQFPLTGESDTITHVKKWQQ
jgi:hypothetical protein